MKHKIFKTMQRFTRFNMIFLAILTIIFLLNQTLSPVLARGPIFDLVQVQGVSPIVQKASFLGPLPEDMVLSINLYLRPADPAGLSLLGLHVNNPKSVAFRKHIGAEEIKKRFALKDNDLQKLTTYLTRSGIKVGEVSQNGSSLGLTAPVSSIEQVLSTKLGYFERDGVEFFANTTPVLLPTSVAKFISSVNGLDNYPRRRPLLLPEPEKDLVQTGLQISTLEGDPVPLVTLASDTSLRATNELPTGRTFLLTISGIPSGCTLKNIWDDQGLYQFKGISSVETKVNSTRPDANGNVQLRLKMANPVLQDQFSILYSSGTGSSVQNFMGQTVLTWSGAPVEANGLTPAQVNKAYNAAQLVNNEVASPGANIAILASAEWSNTDLQTFFHEYSLPVPNVIHKYVGTTGPLATSGPLFTELELDIERAGSAAPGANLYIYQQPWDQPLIDVLAQAIADDQVSVISSSIGMYESEMFPEEIESWQTQLALADAQGITVVFASGDSGAYGNWNNPTSREVTFPSLPNVTLVGGTELAVDASSSLWLAEEAWSPSGRNGAQFYAGGGGFSMIFQRPLWQPGGNIQGDTTKRGVPDFSLQASISPGYSCYISGMWKVIGGTSAGAPTWAGYVGALAHQRGERFGNMNPLLYQIAYSPSGKKAFHQISAGNNGYYTIGNQTGWNPVTGLGSLDVGELTTEIDKVKASTGVGQEDLLLTATGTAKGEINPNVENRAGLFLGMGDLRDGTGNPVSGQRVTGYRLEIRFEPQNVELGDIANEGQADVFSVQIDREAGLATVNASSVYGTDDYGRLLFVPVTLIGSVKNDTTLSYTFSEVRNQDYLAVQVTNPESTSLRRGKILNTEGGGNLGMVDAVAGLQYLAKLQDAGWEEGQVNLINMGSINLSPEGKSTRPGVKGVITLLQYLVNLRDDFLQR